MTLHEKLDEELKILKDIEETRNQIRRTRSAIRKEQLARHVHKKDAKEMKDTILTDMTIGDLIRIGEKMGPETDKVTIRISSPEANWTCVFEMTNKENK